MGAPGPARRLGRPGRPAALCPGAPRHRGVGRLRQDARPAALPPARRVSRPAPDVRERRALVQPVARRAGGLGEGPRRAGLRRGEAPAGPARRRRSWRCGESRRCARPSARTCGSWSTSTRRWSPTQARRGGRALQDAGIAWLEDPVHHLDLAGLADLRRQLEVPIAAGEHTITSRPFARLLDARAVDLLILDLARVGGVTPWRKIAATRPRARVPVCGHVVPEIQVHLLAVDPQQPPGGVRPPLGRHPGGDAADRERRAGGARPARASASSSTTRPCSATRSASPWSTSCAFCGEDERGVRGHQRRTAASVHGGLHGLLPSEPHLADGGRRRRGRASVTQEYEA